MLTCCTSVSIIVTSNLEMLIMVNEMSKMTKNLFI